jgi:hypothetical protein
MSKQPTNRQVLTSLAIGAACFAGLTQAGYQGDATAVIPGTTTAIPAELAKLLLSVAAMFLPGLLNKWMPGLGDIVRKILDSLLKGGDRSAPTRTGERVDRLIEVLEPLKDDKDVQEAIDELVCRLLRCDRQGDHDHAV